MAKKQTQQAKLPDQIIGQDENKSLIEVSIDMNQPVLLVGETGTGKTSLVRELAKQHKRDFIRVNLNGQTSIDEFVGKWLIKDGATHWQDGILVQAMRKGQWLLCDEINAALPEILFVLHSLLDDDKSIRLSEKDGELVKPHENFRFFATMNPFDEYVGTKELNKAFMSRFTMVLDVHYPKPDDEQQILLGRTKISEADATILVEFANQARKAKDKEELYYTCSTRDLLYWASILDKGIKMKLAFKISILNKANKADRPMLISIFDKVTKEISDLLKEYDAKNLPSLLEDIKNMADEVVKEKDNVQQAAEHYKLKQGTLEQDYQNKEQNMQQKFQQKEQDLMDKMKNIEQDALRKALNAVESQLMSGNSSQTNTQPSGSKNEEGEDSGSQGGNQTGSGNGNNSGGQFLDKINSANKAATSANDFLSQDFNGKQGKVEGAWYDKTDSQKELQDIEAELSKLGIKPAEKKEVTPEPGTDQEVSLNGATFALPQETIKNFEGAVGNKKIAF